MGSVQYVKLIGALLLFWSSVVQGQVAPAPKPAYFIFGDSLVDPGNNNYLPVALAKANYPYNGIDYAAGPTGRFCNGRTVADVVADFVGVPTPPPYLQPSVRAGQGIVQGVNYASAAGGILDATGANYIQRIGMNGQLQWFGNTVSQLQTQLGVPQTDTLLATALVTIVIGSNDFINNYFLTTTNTKQQYDTRQYNVLLLNTLNQQLTTLYNFGLRKFVVSNVGPLGCIPNQLAMAMTPNCIVASNDHVQDYNAGLVNMLQQITARLPGSTFLNANVYDSVISFINDPATYGWTSVNVGCCGTGLYNAQLPCLPISTPCQNRGQYVFWDGFHTTEAANVVLANTLWSGGTNFISPINVKQLLNL